MSDPRRVLILGAAGRDFHCFNVVYRGNAAARVVGFTATQIPGISERSYPPELAGPAYPDGIAIGSESELEAICQRERVDEVVFAYSDVPHAHVMHTASRALACGADFTLLGPKRTMLTADLPVIAISAVRTGCGKSQTARWITRRLMEHGQKTAALRHPMPYGDLLAQRVQRFETRADLAAGRCSAEEREEYEPYIELGAAIFAGVDYAAILESASARADIIVWDGGNNDFPFIRPDLHVVLVDALRPDQLVTHHPGEATLRMADVVIVNKVDGASPVAVQRAIDGVRSLVPGVAVLRAASPVRLDSPEEIRGRRVLVVEDGPTITHGGMPYGAGYVAAIAAEAAELVDPRDSASDEIAAVYARHPHIGPVLPAMGYGERQIKALRATIERSRADVVVAGTPIDLSRLLELEKPVVRARYQYEDVDHPGLAGMINAFVEKHRS